MAIVPPHTHPRHEHAQYAEWSDIGGFRNRIINGDFSVNQRAFTSTTTSLSFGLDRWRLQCGGGTVTYSVQTPALGDLPESASAFARIVTSGQSGAGDSALLDQPIESVRTLSGKTATISFWAKAGSGTPKVAVELYQYFGLGGSPGTPVSTYAGQVTLSTTWTRYSVTVAVPSVASKVLGTSGTDNLTVMLWTSAGSTFNSRTGSLGIQSATIDFWGIQVEEGDSATPYEQKTYGDELRACQRYYTRLVPGQRSPWLAGGSSNGSAHYFSAALPTPMRVAPSIASSNPTFVTTGPVGNQCALYSAAYRTPGSWTVYTSPTDWTAVLNAGSTAGYAATWDTGSGFWLEFNAEL